MQAAGSKLVETLDARLRAIFAAYRDNEDVSPAQRFRVEGFAEALILAGELSEPHWIAMIARLYQEEVGQVLPESAAGSNRIPLLMQRAPVYPSTKD